MPVIQEIDVEKKRRRKREGTEQMRVFGMAVEVIKGVGYNGPVESVEPVSDGNSFIVVFDDTGWEQDVEGEVVEEGTHRPQIVNKQDLLPLLGRQPGKLKRR